MKRLILGETGLGELYNASQLAFQGPLQTSPLQHSFSSDLTFGPALAMPSVLANKNGEVSSWLSGRVQNAAFRTCRGSVTGQGDNDCKPVL